MLKLCAVLRAPPAPCWLCALWHISSQGARGGLSQTSCLTVLLCCRHDTLTQRGLQAAVPDHHPQVNTAQLKCTSLRGTLPLLLSSLCCMGCPPSAVDSAVLHVTSVLSCSAGKPAPRIGDGGASWRMKALARAKRQVEDPEDPNYGKRLQEVVGKHWGSLADLTQGLGQERAAHGEGQI